MIEPLLYYQFSDSINCISTEKKGLEYFTKGLSNGGGMMLQIKTDYKKSMKKNTVKLPPTVIQELQNQIKKYERITPLKKGFNQIVRMVGLGYITTGQIAKIVSVFNNQRTPDDKEQIEVYGSKLVAFCKNEVTQTQSKKKISNKLRAATHYPAGAAKGKQPNNRQVDRMNTINTSSTVSPTLPKISDLFEEMVKENLHKPRI